ncbi:translation factor GTPase family protein [Paenibacillus sp. NFR01]|uniref:GTP-binding protein n=1 Tax=Paenibacillus sp. NFR01 TaxID=1566279 RepID=UPI0008B7783B|nr:TetM/TetW/TetO/TetS family tetracycline resistance ribosomal protection protein [Paenibacillus sp. NFR01]SET19273.1 small GTP-binding protein domain-containing protein [Paenibacillus sp. NFR01]
MNITLGLLAHVDAGKTTFAEQLLYHTSAIRSRGRVDHRDTHLDTHELEKARGITIFADQAEFVYGGNRYFLLDTPGHIDFSSEMERALLVLDVAVLIVSAAEGVESHTETVWQLLRRYRIPTMIFINKMDRTGADAERVLTEIRAKLSADAVLLARSLDDPLPEELKQFMAERDDALLEDYLEGSVSDERWQAALKQGFGQGRIFPCLTGSALQDDGIAAFLDVVNLLTHTDYTTSGPFAGRVYKIRHDDNGTRITFIKALQGSLRTREELNYGDAESQLEEKITSIRKYSGSRFSEVGEVTAGELFAVTGLSVAVPGEGVGALSGRVGGGLAPALLSKVEFEPPVHLKEVLRAFQLLGAEDPSLRVNWDESLQELHLRIMGRIQLEVLEQVVKERFGLAVTFGAPEILYMETIAAPAIGCGHFEPLKHYAEVHVLLEPGERGSGVVFKNECHADDLATGYQNQIGQYLLEDGHHGLLTGSPLTDLQITLLTGRAHNKHTHGGDFREAALRALRQGLERTENILLEPVYDFTIRIDSDLLGKVMTDVQQAYGRFGPPEIHGSTAVLYGQAPVATFMDYPVRLAAISQGKGVLTLRMAGYEPCHQADEVIARKNYNKNADPLYSSSSIFCSKGQGYAVPWDEAEKHMHIEVRGLPVHHRREA